MKKAYIFPGQDAQFVGMGKDLYNHSEEAKFLFEQAVVESFSPAGVEYTEGIGVKNICSRVGLLQGSVDVAAAPGRGTVVVI